MSGLLTWAWGIFWSSVRMRLVLTVISRRSLGAWIWYTQRRRATAGLAGPAVEPAASPAGAPRARRPAGADGGNAGRPPAADAPAGHPPGADGRQNS